MNTKARVDGGPNCPGTCERVRLSDVTRPRIMRPPHQQPARQCVKLSHSTPCPLHMFPVWIRHAFPTLQHYLHIICHFTAHYFTIEGKIRKSDKYLKKSLIEQSVNNRNTHTPFWRFWSNSIQRGCIDPMGQMTSGAAHLNPLYLVLCSVSVVGTYHICSPLSPFNLSYPVSISTLWNHLLLIFTNAVTPTLQLTPQYSSNEVLCRMEIFWDVTLYQVWSGLLSGMKSSTS